MLKKKIDYDKAAKMLFSRTERYADNVRRLYATAADELLKLSAMKVSNGVSAAFSFSDSKFSNITHQLSRELAKRFEYLIVSL